MGLFTATAEVSRWTAAVIAQFIRLRRWTTLGVVLLLTLRRITGLLATFLPLKVILLVGSDGVPRYFRSFIEPEQLDQWIVALAMAAVASFVLNIILDRLAGRLAASAGEDVMRDAAEMPLFSQQEEVARNAFGSFVRVFSNVQFATVALVGGAFFHPPFFAFLLAGIVTLYLLTAFLLRESSGSGKRKARMYIEEHRSTYLQIAGSIVFLASFLFLLYEALTDRLNNTLIAILAILIARQVIGAITASIVSLSSLWGSRRRINALIFRHETLLPAQAPHLSTLIAVFGAGRAEKALDAALKESGKEIRITKVEWDELKAPGTYGFSVEGEAQGGKLKCELDVFSPSRRHALAHWQFLAKHVPLRQLGGAEILADVEVPPFSALLIGGDLEERPDGKDWPDIHRQARVRMWSVVPPRQLVRHFAQARPLPGDRLNTELLSRLELVTRSQEERELVHHLLPRIQERLREMPLCIENPDLVFQKTMRTADGDVVAMTWGRWTLAALGGTSALEFDEQEAEALLEALEKSRPEVGRGEIGAKDLVFANRCALLEDALHTSQYASGLRHLRWLGEYLAAPAGTAKRI